MGTSSAVPFLNARLEVPMNDQRRDDAPLYAQSTSDKARTDQPRNYDDPRRRQDKALGQQQLTPREREERWPIG